MDIQLRVTTSAPETSDWSIPVTLFCASAPEPAVAPSVILAEQELLQVSWQLPADNGGSSVLGFQLEMKRDADADFSLAYDGEEDPTVRTWSTTVDAQGNPLVAASYALRVRSRNIVGYSDYSPELVVTLEMKTSHMLSVVSGSGIEESFGFVTNSVHVQAVDEQGNDRTTGGDFFFLHIEQLCYVTDNYRCDLSLLQDNVATLPIIKQMTDNGDGTYYADYLVPEAGTMTVSVVLLRQGGLYAEYFNNAFLDGVPALTRVENFLDYEWGEGLVTEEAGDFVSVHWYGKLRAPITEDFTFILSGDDSFRMWFDNELVIDRWDTCCDDMTIRLSLVQDAFYDIVLEWREF